MVEVGILQLISLGLGLFALGFSIAVYITTANQYKENRMRRECLERKMRERELENATGTICYTCAKRNGCEKYAEYSKMLGKNDRVAFCEWYIRG